MQPPEPKPSPGGSLWPLTLALILGLVVIGVLIFLTIGMFGSVVLAAAALVAFGWLHYLVWGRWLGRVIRDQVEAEEREAAQQAELERHRNGSSPHR